MDNNAHVKPTHVGYLHQRIAELEVTHARLQSECESLRRF